MKAPAHELMEPYFDRLPYVSAHKAFVPQQDTPCVIQLIFQGPTPAPRQQSWKSRSPSHCWTACSRAAPRPKTPAGSTPWRASPPVHRHTYLQGLGSVHNLSGLGIVAGRLAPRRHHAPESCRKRSTARITSCTTAVRARTLPKTANCHALRPPGTFAGTHAWCRQTSARICDLSMPQTRGAVPHELANT